MIYRSVSEFLCLLAILVASSLPRGTMAGEMTGTIRSIDPLVLRQQDYTRKVITPNFKKFDIWDGEKTLILRGDQPREFPTVGGGLGLIEKPTSLKVDVEGQSYTVTIPANQAWVSQDPSQNLYQIDLSLVGLGIDRGDVTEHRDQIFAAYEKDVAAEQALLGEMEKEISGQEYRRARISYARIMAYNPSSEEVQKLVLLLRNVPSEERPIDTYIRDQRELMGALAKEIKGVNFEQMPLPEVLSFVEGWASGSSQLQTTGEETFELLTLIEQIGASPDAQLRLISKAIDVRLEKFLLLAKNGGRPTERDSSIAKYALRYLTDKSEIPGREDYLQQLLGRLVQLDHETRNYLRPLGFDQFALATAIENIEMRKNSNNGSK